MRAIVVSLVLTAATATSQSNVAGGPKGRQPTGYSITAVRFYPEPPPGSETRSHRTTFLKGDTTFIRTEVTFKNHYHGRRGQNLGLVLRYQLVGSERKGETRLNSYIPSSWKTGWASGGRGWRLPGNWPVGSYRVDILYDGRLVAEGRFKVVADSKSRLLDAGNEKLGKRDYDGAIAEFSSLIRQDRNYVRAYVGRAKAKGLKKDYRGAISDLDRAIRLDPKHTYAWGERALNHTQLKQYSAAIKDLSEAVRLDPKYEWAFQLRGFAREKNGDEIGAIADYKQALRLNQRNTRALYNLVALRKKRKELDAGIADCTWLIQLDSKHYFCFQQRGDLYKAKGDEDKALVDYRKALSLQPKNYWTLSSIVQIHEKRKDLKEAIAECDWVLRLDPNNKAAYRERSRLKLKQKDYDGALADLDRVIEMEPKHAYNYISRAQAKAGKHDLDGAIADCTRAIEIKPKNYAMYSRRAAYRAQKGLNEEAIKDYRKSIEFGRYGRGYTLNTILRLRKKMGDLEGAKADFDWAISLDPKKAWPYQTRATWKQNRGDLKGAEEDCTRAIDLEPTKQAYKTRAVLRALLQDPDGAMEDCDRYLGANPPKNELIYSATIRIKARRFKTGIEDCNRALKIDPKYCHAYAMRAVMYHALGDYEKALADMEKAMQLEVWPYMYTERGRLHMYVGNYDAALADFATSIEKRKSKGQAYSARAEAYYELGDYAEALRDYQKACEFQRNVANDNHLMLFVVRWQLGDREGAARQLEAKIKTWKTWDKTVMRIAAARYLLGDLDAETLLKMAKEQPPHISPGWQRAAHFYIGMRQRMDGKLADAVRSFRLTRDGKTMDEPSWRFGRAEIRRILLGVTSKPLAKEVASFLGLSAGAGLTVTSVWEGSPADGAGIRKGDVIVRLNGTPCTQESIENLFQKGNIGDKVRLEYARQGAKKSVDLHLGQSKPVMTAAPPADAK